MAWVDFAPVKVVHGVVALVDNDTEAFEAKVAAGEFGPSAAVRDGDPLAASGFGARLGSSVRVGLAGELVDVHD